MIKRDSYETSQSHKVVQGRRIGQVSAEAIEGSKRQARGTEPTLWLVWLVHLPSCPSEMLALMSCLDWSSSMSMSGSGKTWM